jgi:hypothetical protein
VPRRQVAELAADGLEARGPEVEELTRAETERRPVELLVRDQAGVFLAASAGEPHTEEGRMRSARQLLDAPERRQRTCVSPRTGQAKA